MSLWYKRAGVATPLYQPTNQNTVSLRIWTNERSPLWSQGGPTEPSELKILAEKQRVVCWTRVGSLQLYQCWPLLEVGDLARHCSHWSSSDITALSLVESFIMMKYFHCVATPALLCHKKPAQGTQSPLLGAFLAFRWFFMA